MTHGRTLFQGDRLPTVGEIVEVIRTMPYHVERCVYLRRGSPPELLDEVFIDVIGVWANFDGTRYSADRARGHVRPGWFGAWRLRRAIRWWLRR